MNPSVGAGMPRITFDHKHHKLERIEALEERVALLLTASEAQDDALRNADVALTVQTENVKKLLMMEIKGVAQDLAMMKAWKDQLLVDHPELRTSKGSSRKHRSKSRQTEVPSEFMPRKEEPRNDVPNMYMPSEPSSYSQWNKYR